MARLKKENGKVAFSNAIDRLIAGDYDTPIVEIGNQVTRLNLGMLNVLRMKMRDARDEENRKDESLKLEIASVAHDLKTPLTLISGYAECAQDGLTDKDYLGLISQTASEMNDKVHGFVESMRNGREGKEVRPEKINARQFFGAECAKYKSLTDKLGVKLRIGRIPNVNLYCIKSDLSSVLQNLISNAFKYCGKRKKVYVSFYTSQKLFVIKVKDKGNGISKADLPYVFDRFFMADKSRSEKGSSGLGLYIAKTKVENMQGKIQVKSKEKKGTVFKVFLPWESDKIDVQMSKMGRVERFYVTLFFGFLTTSIVRFMQFHMTGKIKYFFAGLLLIPFFMVGWLADVLSVLIMGRYTLLLGD